MGKNKDIGLLVLRLSVGLLMLLHGINKITDGVGSIEGMLSEKGIPEFIAYGVYIGEVVAPIMLIIGYRARMAAVLFVVNMLVILFLAHSEDLMQLNKYGGWKPELSGLYLFGALTLFFTGAGKFALSSWSKWD